jgi:hypothetical protein
MRVLAGARVRPDPWHDFSRYNVIVQQVEGVADVLADCASKVAPLVGDNEIAGLLLGHLRDAAAQLDRRALRMLSLYDPAARQMLKDGVPRDPRRRPRPGV